MIIATTRQILLQVTLPVVPDRRDGRLTGHCEVKARRLFDAYLEGTQ